MFIFVVFDLGKDPFSIDVKIIFLDPGFPVLTLSVSRQSLLVCSNALGFIFVCEIVCDFAPHLDLSKPLRRFFRSSLLSSVLLVSPVSLRNMLIRSSHILWTQLNHELRHDFCPHNFDCKYCSTNGLLPLAPDKDHGSTETEPLCLRKREGEQ